MGMTLAERFDCLLLDLDGVIYRGPHEVRGAVDALTVRVRAGQPCVYVTNNAARTARAVADHLRSFGLVLDDSDVVTSPQAAVALLPTLVDPGSAVLVVGGVGIESVLLEQGYRPVRSLAEGPSAVMQGFSPQVTWADLAEAAYAVESGLPWIATNPDLTFPTERGLAPGNGSLVAAVANAVARQPDAIAGKPEPPLLHEALRRCGCTSGLMIGDRIDTDIRGGSAAGVPTLLVLTGVHGVADLLAATGPDHPDFVAADLEALNEPYPQVRLERSAAGASASCEGFTCRVDRSGGVVVAGAGRWINAVRALAEAFEAARAEGIEGSVPQALRALEAVTGTVAASHRDEE